MTAMPPTWTILVPTLGERSALFARLMDGLLPQLNSYAGRARVMSWFSNGRPSLPEIRQALVATADADYVSFIDDDDLVAPYYVDEIMRALAQTPEYIGFQVQCYSNGSPTAIAYHSLAHGQWLNLPDRYLRDISHINPIRRDLALKADFRLARHGQPEDRAWADQLRRGRFLRQEIVVNRIMYHYLFVPPAPGREGSRARVPRMIRAGFERTTIDHPYFSWSDRA